MMTDENKHCLEGVSVIVPMKDAEGSIEKCIRSLVAQTYKPIEIIVVDDGSKDKSFEIVSSLKKHIPNLHLFHSDSSHGAAKARNIGISHSKYEFIAMQDADDWSSTDRIEKEMKFIKEHSDYDIVGSGCYRVNENQEFKQVIPKAKVYKKDLIKGGNFIHASCIFRKHCLLDVNGYTSNKYTMRDQDYHMLMKLYAKGYKLYNLQESLYYYYSDDNTYSRQIDTSKVKGLMWIRLNGYRLNKMPVWAYIYVLKPLLACLIPHKIMMYYYKKISDH